MEEENIKVKVGQTIGAKEKNFEMVSREGMINEGKGTGAGGSVRARRTNRGEWNDGMSEKMYMQNDSLQYTVSIVCERHDLRELRRNREHTNGKRDGNGEKEIREEER